MTFSSDVKKELIFVKTKNVFQKKAFIYGIFLFSNGISINDISFYTEYRVLAEIVSKIICKNLNVICQTKTKLSHKINNKKLIKFSIPFENDRQKVMDFFDFNNQYNNLTIYKKLLADESSIKSFLAGGFLSCGTIFEPNKEYHLDFSIKQKQLATELLNLLDLCSIDVKFNIAKRKNEYIVYIKGSEHIFDFLAFIGAKNSAMKLMQVKMLKEMRNYVNRTTNFEAANIEKTAVAAATQIEAITIIKNSNSLHNYLSDELIELCELRIKNPDMSLNDLGKALNTPISRSGVNHRFKKIIKIANDIKKAGGN